MWSENYRMGRMGFSTHLCIKTGSRETRKKCSLYPLSFLPSSRAPYFLKVSVWEINDHSAAEDDSLHKDDIELISEMLQNWLFDVYC